MKTATLNFWNSRKNYGVASVGKSNIYIKRHHVTTPPAPMVLKGGMEVEIDLEINGMEIKSTCILNARKEA
ncbi:hypothetical protein N9C44_01200 [bacterium]|jgi:hypothetical protein|nr:hypothetical protein [bacterium]|tara:strand:- start:10 stop:222 length:213 start_codon:yes stop_codon:yes gene_type:complete